MSGQQAGTDWAGMAAVGPLLVVSAAVWASMHWRWMAATVAPLALWWRSRPPLTRRGAERLNARARAEAPDWGRPVDAGEQRAWQLLVADFYDEDEEAVTGPMGETW